MQAKGSKAPPLLAAFISYAKADQAKAQEVAASLEERGFKCWIAPRDVRPGRSYGDEIIRGIEKSRYFVLLLSEASNGSAFVAREVERAISKNRPVFTVRIDEVEPSPALELFISGMQWIDAWSGKLGPHIDRLASFLTEEEGVEPVKPPLDREGARPKATRKWAWAAGTLSVVLLIGLAGTVVWQSLDQRPEQTLVSDPSVITDPKGAPADRQIHASITAPEEMLASRGYQQQMQGDLDGALSNYTEALRLNPSMASIYNNRGNIYRDKGDYDRAIDDYDQAIKLGFNEADPYASRGWIYQQKGDVVRARDDFEMALGLNPAAALKTKLNAALGSLGPATSESDPLVITDPNVFVGNRELPAKSAAPPPNLPIPQQ